MKKKIIITIFLLAILTITLAYVIVKRAAPPTTLYVDPQTIDGRTGQNFAITIKISDAIDLYGCDFRLRWNTTILDVVDVTEGTFLKSGGDTFFTYKVNATEGHIIVDGTLLGNKTGVSGNGALATIQFHVKESGDCVLDLYNAMLINSSEQSITPTTIDGHFRAIP